MLTGQITQLRGSSFVVSDERGDLNPGSAEGFFCADTRYLDRLVLRLSGRRLVALRSGTTMADRALFYLTNQASRTLPAGALTVVRERWLDQVGRLHEKIEVANYAGRPVRTRLTLELGSDFADIFEARGKGVVGKSVAPQPSRDGLQLTGVRDGAVSRLSITSRPRPRLMGLRAAYPVALAPGGCFTLLLSFEPDRRCRTAMAPSARRAAHGWVEAAPRLVTADHRLLAAYVRSLSDLASLRLALADHRQIPAAGLPWFVAVFGRDALVTGFETLVLGPELAAAALDALAAYQARADEPGRDAEPGKIPHEVRVGVLATSGRLPHARYYGSVDATPLYVVLLAELFRWTRDRALLARHLPTAEAALAWIEHSGDLDGDGFVEYRRRAPEGLRNQGWKDSDDAIRFADGRVAEGPIALCEVQAYVHAARLAIAELYEAVGRGTEAQRQRAEAELLRRRFEDAFWLPEEGTYALALDGAKRRVDAVASNAGHCLWAGIASPERASSVAERLLAPDMFSGWGIRTMAASAGGYSPVSYHCGSVWPHDNAMIAAGFRRYGLDAAAERVVVALLEASDHFPGHRLPELFCGFERREGGFPVDYPAACSPQAWAAAAVPYLLQTLLGLRPADGRLVAAPLAATPRLELRGVRGPEGAVDLRAEARRAELSPATGLPRAG
ncbi:MAG TPA: glycogen debranching N-terminal domain-containing protein [Chloroflexota bacterium]|nr:glycogen debranching N-terminal domain-containing protein [Chloroflexota bacterium]